MRQSRGRMSFATAFTEAVRPGWTVSNVVPVPVSEAEARIV